MFDCGPIWVWLSFFLFFCFSWLCPRWTGSGCKGAHPPRPGDVCQTTVCRWSKPPSSLLISIFIFSKLTYQTVFDIALNWLVNPPLRCSPSWWSWQSCFLTDRSSVETIWIIQKWFWLQTEWPGHLYGAGRAGDHRCKLSISVIIKKQKKTKLNSSHIRKCQSVFVVMYALV